MKYYHVEKYFIKIKCCSRCKFGININSTRFRCTGNNRMRGKDLKKLAYSHKFLGTIFKGFWWIPGAQCRDFLREDSIII